MVLESSTDRDALLADFGDTVTFGANTFQAMFAHEYVEALGMDGESPILNCKTSDITALSVAIGSTVAVVGTNYTVVGNQADGTGFTVLILEEQ